MATATFAASNTSLSHNFFTLDDTLPAGRPREASFSSDLPAVDDSFSLRLSGEIADHQMATVQVSLWSGRKKKAAEAAAAKDDEFEVFGAEKYFNGDMDGEEVGAEPEKPWKASPHKEVELAGRKTRPGTPSVCSEASGSSRSSLLKDVRRQNRSQSSQRSHYPLPVSKKFLGIFPCSCSDDSAVEVNKNAKKGGLGGGFPASRPLGQRQPRAELWCNEETIWGRAEKAGGGGGTQP